MNTDETIFTDSEIENAWSVGTFASFTDYDFRTFCRVIANCIAVRTTLPIEFAKWFKKIIEHEAARRRSGGEIELSTIAVPIERLNTAERRECLFFLESTVRLSLFNSTQHLFLDRIRWQFVVSFIVDADRTIDRTLTRRQVAELLQIDDAKVNQLVREGRIPEPLMIGPKTPRWLESSIYSAMRK